MALDLILRGANLADGRRGVDIGVEGGRIAAIEPGLEAEAGEEGDVRGRLVTAPFIDAHFHMDATLSLGLPRLNRSGTLLEGIQLWGELKRELTVEAVIDRALAYCDLAVARGIGAIRSHVDVCDDSLTGVQALLEVRDKVRDWLDLQLVAFPQDGFYRSPNAEANLKNALEMGVDVVGGIPHFERTMADGAESVRALCRIAAERGLLVDMHCDESDDPMSRHIETLAAETHRLGLAGRVVGSHLTSMHSMDNYYATKLIPLIAEAGVGVVSNPLINIAIQGRQDSYPRRRGLTRIPELRTAGIPVALAQDCVMDPWYSLGTGDMLDAAHMAVHAVPMTSLDDIDAAFAMVTETPARLLHLDDYGIAPGKAAHMVVLEAADPFEAVRTRATRLQVYRAGRLIAETPPRTTRLALAGRPATVSPTRPPRPAAPA